MTKIYLIVNGNPRKTRTEKCTIVDSYLRQLNTTGVSLKELNLLGNADYSDKNLLEDEANKQLVEKYIAEFIRADLITQEFHKRRGTELVSEKNQNNIDGGIYLYRSKKEATISENEFDNGNYETENVAVTDKDYEQMTYVDIEEFQNMVKNNDIKVRYKFTIDRDTDELLVAKITTTQIVEADISDKVSEWFADLYNWLNQYKLAGTTTYEIETVRIPYKEYISKYIMPYEFLINLCEITQNPEFVYHVALLARDTRIQLVIQDDTTINRETIETETDKSYFKNMSSNSTSGAGETPLGTTKRRKTTTVTTQTPVLKIDYADTWSFYEEFEYTKNTKGTLTETGPIVNRPSLPGTLSGYQPPVTEESYDAADGSDGIVPVTVTRPEYWYDTFVTETRTSTQLITTITTYSEPILKNSVEKSKQFLGLLRSENEECPYECFEESAWVRQNPQALYCTQKAEFYRQGKDVEYQIPNYTEKKSPIDNLLNGIELLYATLLSNSSGYDEDEKIADGVQDQKQYIADEDYESAYVSKMQGLVEHLKYLMTFPENESYTIKDFEIEDIFDEDKDNNYEDEDEDEDEEDDEEEDENYIPEHTWDGTTTELIEMLGKYANQDMKESGILASVTIAQALVESGWGKSQLSATYNNYFGIKKGSGWDGPTVTMSTREVINGKTVTVKAKFRVYDSPLESLKNHSKILSASRYSGVKGEKDYRKAITIIKNGGYATDPNYVNTICNVIEKHGLTRFDK